MRRPTLALFDVDGTLLLAGGAGRRAMQLAFDELFGRPDALEGIDFRGMTDGPIFRTAIAAIGGEPQESIISRLSESYLAHLERTIAEAQSFVILPGVSELLAQLDALDHVVSGLGTGNLEAGAWIKVERAGLRKHFAYGGFGSDHDDRGEVLRIGAGRGAASVGCPLSACRVVVVGDTPRDVAAARAIGAECLAVATGGYDAAALQQAGADVVVTDLTDPGAERILAT